MFKLSIPQTFTLLYLNEMPNIMLISQMVPISRYAKIIRAYRSRYKKYVCCVIRDASGGWGATTRPTIMRK